MTHDLPEPMVCPTARETACVRLNCAFNSVIGAAPVGERVKGRFNDSSPTRMTQVCAIKRKYRQQYRQQLF